MIIIEKIPTLICDICESSCVIMTNKGIECDDCNRITAQTSDLTKQKKNKLEKLLTPTLTEK